MALRRTSNSDEFSVSNPLVAPTSATGCCAGRPGQSDEIAHFDARGSVGALNHEAPNVSAIRTSPKSRTSARPIPGERSAVRYVS